MEELSIFVSELPWDSILGGLVLLAAFVACRSITRMKRPVCKRACPGCHGARQGRGCAMAKNPDRA